MQIQMKITFTKMHGLGNDYLYVDCFRHSFDGIDAPALSRAMSDRHRGVGSDGLILIRPPTPGVAADVRMEMYNADGSRGVMCGNGIRCVAKYAVEHGLIREEPTAQAVGHRSSPTPPIARAVGSPDRRREVTLLVETDRGVLELIAHRADDGRVHRVRVDMGPPILEPERIPVRWPVPRESRLVRVSLRPHIPIDDCRPPRAEAWMESCGLDPCMTCVSMGNPHVVLFCANIDAIPLEDVGPFIERRPLFPDGVNVHFAQVRDRGEATMRTWERGSGITQACGTGACAVLVAGVLEDRLDRQATLHLPGGDLRIEWPEDRGSVFMTGPAEEVFTGDWLLNGI